MSAPTVVSNKVGGELVFDVAPVAVSGLSGMGGTHRLYFGTGPDVLLYDSGGVFGSASAWPVVSEPALELYARWADRGRALIGQGRFGGARSAGFVLEGGAADRVAPILTGLLGAEEGALRGGLPIGVQCDFVADREELQAAVEARSEAAAAAIATLVTPFKTQRSPRQAVGALLLEPRKLPAPDGAMVEHLACGELFVRVQIADGRLLLSRDLPGDVADIPCAQLVHTEGGLVGSVMVAGFEVERLILPPGELPGLKPHFGGTTAAIPRGTTDQVELVSPGGEKRRADLVLTRDRISLRERDGTLIHAFDLDNCGLQGTSVEFLVVDAEAGPFRIKPHATRFQERILVHRGVAAAAERTLREGPYLGVDPDDAPVAVEVSAGGPRVRGAVVPECVPPVYETDGERPWLVLGNWRFSAPSEVLESVANHLAARLATDPDQILDELPGLEAHWMIYSAFGAVLETHRALVEVVGDPLQPPEEAEERLLLLTRLSERVPYVRREVQTARLQLSRVLRRSDARLAERTGVSAAAVELDLSGLLEVERQLDRIEAQIAQLDWLRKALAATTPGYGRLAAQLGMSIINPLRLVGTGAEAVRIAAIKRIAASAEAEGSGQVSQACVEAWNHLMRVVLPSAAQDLLDSAMPSRVSLAQALAEAPESDALHTVLALRHARLRNHTAFPAQAGAPPRQEAIARLRDLMRRAGDSLSRPVE